MWQLVFWPGLSLNIAPALLTMVANVFRVLNKVRNELRITDLSTFSLNVSPLGINRSVKNK